MGGEAEGVWLMNVREEDRVVGCMSVIGIGIGRGRKTIDMTVAEEDVVMDWDQ